jgi:hypothetical protein
LEFNAHGLVHDQAHLLKYFDIITISRQPTLDKDLEIPVLRRQISILQPKTNSPIRPSWVEELISSVLTIKLKKITDKTKNQLKCVIRIIHPETVVRCLSFLHLAAGKFRQ